MADTVNARPPAWADGIEVSGADMRAGVLGALASKEGTVRGDAVTALPTPAMAVRVPPRLDLVADGQNGYYPLELTLQTDLDIDASSATLPRIDSVIAEVVDNGDDTSIFRFRVVNGTPASSPVAPTLPYADQPTALTRRIADVLVRANAESNGFIRPQDVTNYTITAIARSVQNSQVSTPTCNTKTAGVWTPFTSAQWPALQVIIPPSEVVNVTISGELQNTNTSASTMRLSADLVHTPTGTTIAADVSRCVCGHYPTQASRRFSTSWPGLAGQTLTVTPSWRTSSQPSSSEFLLQYGQLLLEPQL